MEPYKYNSNKNYVWYTSNPNPKQAGKSDYAYKLWTEAEKDNYPDVVDDTNLAKEMLQTIGINISQ